MFTNSTKIMMNCEIRSQHFVLVKSIFPRLHYSLALCYFFYEMYKTGSGTFEFFCSVIPAENNLLSWLHIFHLDLLTSAVTILELLWSLMWVHKLSLQSRNKVRSFKLAGIACVFQISELSSRLPTSWTQPLWTRSCRADEATLTRVMLFSFSFRGLCSERGK